MNELDRIMEIIEAAGFSHTGKISMDTVELRDEVRDMCHNGNCGKYARNWSCPPGCGTLDQCRQQLLSYKTGILVQTVGEIEDSMDWEGMKDTEERHKKTFLETAEKLRKIAPGFLPLGAGTCTLCRECTYPDSPCRQPERRISSMEAYGILVSDICSGNQVKYYYGPKTIAYTSCYFFDFSS